MRTLTRFRLPLLAAVLAAVALTACDAQPPSQQQEADARQSSYDNLTANQPAQSMNYSPTRETVNFWVETWDEPGKLAFVYLQNALGEITGYFVLEGPPVSYCALLTPSYETIGREGRVVVPAPGIDGAYYGDGPCHQYYGRDATTGAFVEFTAAGAQNYLLYDQPLTFDGRPEPMPLGQTTVDDVS